jgi:hypothetical protein
MADTMAERVIVDAFSDRQARDIPQVASFGVPNILALGIATATSLGAMMLAVSLKRHSNAKVGMFLPIRT